MRLKRKRVKKPSPHFKKGWKLIYMEILTTPRIKFFISGNEQRKLIRFLVLSAPNVLGNESAVINILNIDRCFLNNID